MLHLRAPEPRTRRAPAQRPVHPAHTAPPRLLCTLRARACARRERTEYDFTVTWRPPRAIGGSDGGGELDEISHYAIELATCAPAGTRQSQSALIH